VTASESGMNFGVYSGFEKYRNNKNCWKHLIFINLLPSVNLDKDSISTLLDSVETLILNFKNYKNRCICKRSYKNG
jgi:hypothetical protein